MTREEEVGAASTFQSAFELESHSKPPRNKDLGAFFGGLATVPLKEPAGRVLPLAGERVSHTSSSSRSVRRP